jgi:hypothetical protein
MTRPQVDLVLGWKVVETTNSARPFARHSADSAHLPSPLLYEDVERVLRLVARGRHQHLMQIALPFLTYAGLRQLIERIGTHNWISRVCINAPES